MKLMREMIWAMFFLALPVAVAAQQGWETPRTPDGQPDLQGVWTNSSQTPLVRPEEFGAKGFLTEEEAQDVEQGWRDRSGVEPLSAFSSAPGARRQELEAELRP